MGNHDLLLQPDQIIAQLTDYASFVDSLHRYSDEVLRASMEKSQWSVCDSISHIMRWDENFAQTTLARIVNQERVVLDEHADVQLFNDQAIAYGRTLPAGELLTQAVKLRLELVSLLHQVQVPDFFRTFSAPSSYTLSGFLQEMFVSHDAHHRKQMEQFLASGGDHGGAVPCNL
ncbi:MAG: hypothetical protein K0R57_447 [Paenibacillaceae bacterium]|jgi:hypothetical protein|nr:hypothetical protein [Paenibacillaceae bacterium]